MKITVLAGGLSPERDVSLSSGALIAAALMRSGHDVALIDVYEGVSTDAPADEYFSRIAPPPYKVAQSEPNLDEIKKRNGNRNALIGPRVLEICKAADVVFVALHGAMGENGQLQATLDNFDIRYTGSGYDGSLLAMDKELTKKIIGSEVNTPEGISGTDITSDLVLEKVGLPCVVKPCDCGSSVGVSIVKTLEELDSALELACAFGSRVIVEKMIKGREFSVGILDGEALPPIEIIPKEGFYDYKNKYQAGKTVELCPAPIDDALMSVLADQTKLAFDALRLSGYSRFDYIVDKDGKSWCLEANTLPGMTPTSLLPQMAAAVGISYGKLCCKIVELALKK